MWLLIITVDFPSGPEVKESACNAGVAGSIPELGRSPGGGQGYPLQYFWVSLVAQTVKNLPAMWDTWVQSLGWEDLLEEGMTTHSSILAWRIPMNRGAWQATVHRVNDYFLGCPHTTPPPARNYRHLHLQPRSASGCPCHQQRKGGRQEKEASEDVGGASLWGGGGNRGESALTDN